MAVTVATIKELSLGNVRGKLVSLTGDGSVKYAAVVAGEKLIAAMPAGGSSADYLMPVLNSNDGTENTADGYLYFYNTALGSGQVAYFIVILE
jgi:hypothetical protein